MTLALLLAALCTLGIALEPKGTHVMVVTLEESSDTRNRPSVGIDDFNRLGVAARVEELRKGALPFEAGAHIALGVHSVAKTFGGDYAGERYEIGLEPVPVRIGSVEHGSGRIEPGGERVDQPFRLIRLVY